MKLIIQLFISMFLANIFIIGNVMQCASANEQKTGQTLLILGDSLSAGYGISQEQNWTALVQHKLNVNNKEIRLINASISGDTTANGLNRLPGALHQLQPEWIMIELGANDGLRGLSLTHIKNNLQSLIKTSLATGAKVLLMEIKIPPNYGTKYASAFNRIYHQLAEQYTLPLIPFLLNDIAVNPELMQTDGLHPNEKAQMIIAANLWQALEPILSK